MTDKEQIAELEARLAMKDEALAIMLASAYPHPTEHPTMTAAWKVGKDAIEADATAVAAFLQRIEQRGAAKELRRMAGQCGRQFTGTRRYSTPDLLARADELERP